MLMPSKRAIALASVAAAAIFLGGGLSWYFLRLTNRGKSPLPEEMGKEKIIEEQLDELERLKNANSFLSGGQIGSSLKELENLRKKNGSFSEEIGKQLEEMENLRNQ
jgi:hypothetical protein